MHNTIYIQENTKTSVYTKQHRKCLGCKLCPHFVYKEAWGFNWYGFYKTSWFKGVRVRLVKHYEVEPIKCGLEGHYSKQMTRPWNYMKTTILHGVSCFIRFCDKTRLLLSFNTSAHLVPFDINRVMVSWKFLPPKPKFEPQISWSQDHSDFEHTNVEFIAFRHTCPALLLEDQLMLLDAIKVAVYATKPCHTGWNKFR